MPNAVEIVITVNNAQAVPAVKQTIASFDQLVPAIQANSASLQALTAQLNTTAASMTRAGNATRSLGGYMSTNLDAVRLLSQEFGLRLPRALEAMLSRMPAITTAISSVMGAITSVAIAEVFIRGAAAVYNLYDKYISLNAVAQEYNRQVQAHKDEDFINPHSIETATERINEATEAAKTFRDVGTQIHDTAWSGILSALGGNMTSLSGALGGLFGGTQMVRQGFKSQGQSDALDPKALSMQHELTLMQIEANHAADSELRGRQKINAELQKRLELNRENQRYTSAQDAGAQGGGLRSSGAQKQAIQDATARAEAAAKMVELQRAVTEKTVTLQNEATNAGLQGNALLLAQKLQAEAEIRRSGIGTQSEINAVELRYNNEFLKRMQDEQEAVEKRARAEQEATLPAYGKIQAQGMDRLGDIDERQKKGLYADQNAPGQDSALAARDRATATAQMYREMADAQKRFDEEQQAELDRSTADQLGAFGKIDHDLQQSLNRRADAYVRFYGDLNQNDQVHIAARAQLQAGNDADVSNASRQRAQLEQTLHDETLQRDREAAASEAKGRGDGLGSWVDKYRSSIAEIQAQHTAMLAKINAEESKPGVTQNAFADYEKQKVDADRIANAQIEDANQQMAHSIAGMLEGAFDNPVKFIQNRMKQMMFEIISGWLAQTAAFSSVFGNQVGGAGHAGGIGQHLGGLGGGAGSFASSPLGALAQRVGINHSSTSPGAVSGPGTQPFGGSIGTSSQGAFGFGGTSSTSVPAAVLPAGGGIGSSMLSSASMLASTGANLASFWNNSSTAAPFADNGESGGFAGYMTGDTSDMATGLGSFGGDDSLSTQATQQAMQQAGAAGGMASGAAGVAGQFGSLASAGLGAYTGFQGLVSTFESGKGSGVLTGAASGAELGASIGMLGGPMGAAIGGAIGAGVGAATGLISWATGEGNRLGAAKYFKSNMRPQMDQAEQMYSRGSGSADSAISAINQVAVSGYSAIAQQFGGSAAQWAQTQYISKEQKFLTDEINQLARGGHDYGAASAVQFHTGGRITGFGDLATSRNEGFIHTILGETVANPAATSTHGAYIDAMNGGASEAEIAGMYLRNTSARFGAGGSGGDTHNHYWDVDALDAASVKNWLNSGAMDQIAQATTKRNTRYAGEAD